MTDFARVRGLAETEYPEWPIKSKQAVVPFGDRMLVLLDEKTKHSVEGTGIEIVLPEQARERPDSATVINLGPDITAAVSPGDKVLVSRYGGVDVKVEGHDGKFLIVRQSDVLGRVQDLGEEFWPEADDPPDENRLESDTR